MGPSGRLDGRVHGPMDGQPVLVLHPHPQFGGSMGSRLVYDLAVGLADAGFRVVRFNYRGVGRSEGSYGEGVGEVEDAEAVYDVLRGESGRDPVVVGFSFGGGVAVRLCASRGPAALVLVATPSKLLESSLVPLEEAAGVGCPSHVVVGSRDGFVSVEDAKAMQGALGVGGAGLTVLEAAGHFLEPSHNGRAVAAVLEAVRGLLP